MGCGLLTPRLGKGGLHRLRWSLWRCTRAPSPPPLPQRKPSWEPSMCQARGPVFSRCPLLAAQVVSDDSPHFTEKATEAQGGQTTHPRSHSWDQTATRGVAYGNMGPSQAPAPRSCPGEHSEGHRYMDCETLGACPATGSREQPLLSVSPEGEQLHRNRWCLGLREPPECPVRPVSCAVRGPAMGSVAWGTQAGQSPCMHVLANPRLSRSVLWVISWDSTNIR